MTETRVIERVLVGQYNTFIDQRKKIINVSKKRLEELLIEELYYVYNDYPSLNNYDIIDNTKVLGFLNNFRIIQEEITDIIKLYADFNITYRGKSLIEGNKHFYMHYLGNNKPIQHIEGDDILKIMGWVLK